MKIVVKREELIKSLSNLSLIIKDNSIRPIISGTKLEAKNGEIKFTGTTLETTIKNKLSFGVIHEEGVAVFKVALVLEYIKLLDEEEIEIKSDEGRLFIHNAEFAIMDDEDYPSINDINGDKLFSIEWEEFSKSIDLVKFSAAQTTENLAINAIRLATTENKIVFTTTDSYRLSQYTCENENDLVKEISLPLESAVNITKLFKDEVDKIDFYIQGSQLITKCGTLDFTTRLIDMPFPDYNGIISSITYDKAIEVNRDEFNSAIKKVITIAKRNQETKNGAFFDFIGNKIKITVSSGSAKTTQKVNSIKEGDDFRASLNAKFISDFISNINKNLIINATNSKSMFIFKELNNENYKYILMPLALRD